LIGNQTAALCLWCSLAGWNDTFSVSRKTIDRTCCSVFANTNNSTSIYLHNTKILENKFDFELIEDLTWVCWKD